MRGRLVLVLALLAAQPAHAQGVEDRPDDDPLQHDSEGAHGCDRREHRQPEREPEGGHQGQAQERAEHHQLALREVHQMRRLVDHHQRQRHQLFKQQWRQVKKE